MKLSLLSLLCLIVLLLRSAHRLIFMTYAGPSVCLSVNKSKIVIMSISRLRPNYFSTEIPQTINNKLLAGTVSLENYRPELFQQKNKKNIISTISTPLPPPFLLEKRSKLSLAKLSHNWNSSKGCVLGFIGVSLFYDKYDTDPGYENLFLMLVLEFVSQSDLNPC